MRHVIICVNNLIDLHKSEKFSIFGKYTSIKYGAYSDKIWSLKHKNV